MFKKLWDKLDHPSQGLRSVERKKKSVVAISQKKIINEISSAIKKNTYFYFRCIRNCLPLLSPSIPSFFILQDIHNDPSENANKPSHGIAYHQRWFPFSPVKNQRGHKWKTCQSFLKLTRSSIKIGPNMHKSLAGTKMRQIMRVRRILVAFLGLPSPWKTKLLCQHPWNRINDST